MPLVDMPSDALVAYKPDLTAPADFDSFWEHTLDEARQHPLDARFEPVNYALQTVETFDVTFAGYGGQPVKGWFIVSAGAQEPLPCVVEYIGYGGGRGYPLNWLMWPSAGYAYLVMDTRGQGSASLHGDTPDPGLGANPAHPGFMTQGILDPETYYYRRVFTDGARAVEAARSHPLVDSERIAVTGGSQGGGITIAVSSLLPEVAVAMPEVPYLCHFRRAAEIALRGPYNEITRYLSVHRHKEQTVFATLAYFDGMNFAARAQNRALYSVGLMDDICPPSTVYAAYNHLAAPKDMIVYNFNNHEGGGIDHKVEQLRFLGDLWNLM